MKQIIFLLSICYCSFLYGSDYQNIYIMSPEGYNITYMISSEYHKTVVVGRRVAKEGFPNGGALSTDAEGVVVIPSVVEYKGTEYTVVSIGNNAFSGCSKITNVILPETVTDIGSNAFENCTSLKSIDYPTVNKIGPYAFSNCTSLEDISIPNVTIIDSYAFNSCSSLKFISIPNVTRLGSFAFMGCSAMESMVYPTKIERLGSNVFYDGGGVKCNLLFSSDLDGMIRSFCTKGRINYNSPNTQLFIDDIEVTEIVIPDDVTNISQGAFRNCKNITTITLPDNIESIGSDAFSGCERLGNMQIPDGVNSIGKYAFSGCDNFTEVNIPSSVSTLGESAFAGCDNLKNVTIGENMSTLEYRTFYGCSSLENVSISEGLTAIGQSVFEECANLKSVSLPESLESIDQYAFSGCGFESLTLPKNLNTFYGNSILSCTKLMTIHSRIENPSFNLYSYSLTGVPALAILYVPYGKKDVYQNKWTFCNNIIEEIKIGNTFVTEITQEESSYDATFMVVGEELLTAQIGDGVSASITGMVDGSFDIPSSVIGHDGTKFQIVGIGDNAFDGVTITSISIPKQVKYIGNGAFSDCSNTHVVYVNWRRPSDIEVKSNNFEDLPSDAVLYVPAGTKERYAAHEVWGRFSQVIESGPISIGDITATNGSTANLPINLNNEEEIAGLQFRLTLPNGVSVDDNNGELIATLTDRTTNMTVMGRKDPDEENSYLFVLLSFEGESITGNEGALIDVKLNVAPEVEVGDYEVKLDEVFMATSSLATLSPSASTSELSVKDYALGDVNSNGGVDIGDAVTIVNYLVGKESTTFVEKAADTNKNQRVDIGDAVTIVNFLVGKTASLSRNTRPTTDEREPQ